MGLHWTMPYAMERILLEANKRMPSRIPAAPMRTTHREPEPDRKPDPIRAAAAEALRRAGVLQ
jgi:hypothetical protein